MSRSVTERDVLDFLKRVGCGSLAETVERLEQAQAEIERLRADLLVANTHNQEEIDADRAMTRALAIAENYKRWRAMLEDAPTQEDMDAAHFQMNMDRRDAERWRGGSRICFPEFCGHADDAPGGVGWYHTHLCPPITEVTYWFETANEAMDAALAAEKEPRK